MHKNSLLPIILALTTAHTLAFSLSAIRPKYKYALFNQFFPKNDCGTYFNDYKCIRQTIDNNEIASFKAKQNYAKKLTADYFNQKLMRDMGRGFVGRPGGVPSIQDRLRFSKGVQLELVLISCIARKISRGTCSFH